VLVLLAAVLGATLAVALHRMPIILQTSGFVLALTIVLLGGSLWAYAQFRLVFEPFTPLAAALFAAVFVRWLLTLRRQHSGTPA